MIFATNVENIPIEGKIPNFILLVQNLNVVCMKSINNYRKNQHNSIIMRNIKQINHNYIVYSTFIVHRQTDGNGHPISERNLFQSTYDEEKCVQAEYNNARYRY